MGISREKSVAIIGGGISGLSVAYKLVREGIKGKITVVEKSPTLGGNAATAEVELGTDFREKDPKPFVRFADLGVNDINLASYCRVKEAMEHINYPTKENIRRLEDTVAFFTPDFEEIWTKDGNLTGKKPESHITIRSEDSRAVVDTRYSLHIKDKQLHDDEYNFMTAAAEDFNPKTNLVYDKYMTVKEYVEYFKENRLSETGISRKNLERLVRLFLYPRISAMYFADERGPQQMPMLGVMSYYRLQEGIGLDKQHDGSRFDDRCYFTKGSHHWIEKLAEWLQTNNENKVEIRLNFEAKVTGNGNQGVNIENVSPDSDIPSFEADQVVMAGYADDQLNALKAGDSSDPILTKDMEKNLGNIQHAVSWAYAHTWSKLLPPDPATWRTYNVMIRDTDPYPGLKIPYQMTYVQNRHRNDRKNEVYNHYGLPVYFVSLNPQEKIPKQYILRRTSRDKDRVIKKPDGYSLQLKADDPDTDLATARFRHTVITPELLKIQHDLPEHQGMGDGRVFFAGNWTNGAGLHEECFEQAELVVKAMTESG